jgi:hypothetical protein
LRSRGVGTIDQDAMVSHATVEEITAEDLAEMFGEELGRCQYGMGFGFGRVSFPIWWCKKPATRVILFTCPTCGQRRTRLCEECFRSLKSPFPSGTPKCRGCKCRGHWKDAG